MRRRVLGFGDCCYHVVSRVNERRYYLGEEQKQHFLKLLYASAEFSGVEIITYCIMDDHFHLLIRVPTPENITDKELLRRLKVLYKPEEYDALKQAFEHFKKTGDQELKHAFRRRFEHRMYNLSEFVRTLKHRFSLWYNKKYDREGPLWTGKFTSVLIQSSADEYGLRALTAVATYIDLNAVRANLVKNPSDYAWCGLAQAVLGDKTTLKGLKYAFGRAEKGVLTSKTALKSYQMCLQDGFASKLSDFSRGWIIGKGSFIDFVTCKRPECFKTGRFEVAEDISAFAGVELCKVRSLKKWNVLIPSPNIV